MGVKAGLSSVVVLHAVNSQQDGDARIFAQLNKDELRFDHSEGRWYIWERHYWKEDKVEEVITRVRVVIATYQREAKKWNKQALKESGNGKEEAAKKAEKNRAACLHKIALLQKRYWKREVIALAAAGTRPFPHALGISGEEWDRDPWLLCCRNGVVDLRTGDIRDGRQSDYIRTVCPVEWKGLSEPAPTWEEFIYAIFAGDEELIQYIQRLLGYALSGQCTEHVFLILWGAGRNGKGTLLEILAYVLGLLAGPIKSEMFLEQGKIRAANTPDPDILELRGKRIVWGSETNEGKRLDIGRIKWFSGGDSLTGRPLYGKRSITFPPTHTAFLLTNHKPRIDCDDFAIWQRIHLIPFNVQFIDNPGEGQRKRDRSLVNKLKKEASGILAWLVSGCIIWQAIGLNPPPTVTAATQAYKDAEDTFKNFIGECCTTEPQGESRAGELYSSYEQWCKENGHRPISLKKFGERLKDDFESRKVNGCVFYFGITLNEPEAISLKPE